MLRGMEIRALLSNGWIGKVVLTCVAIALAPEKLSYAALVIVLGFAAGYEWDLYAGRHLRGGGGVASPRALLQAAATDPWPVLLCCGLGRIASSPGPVLPEHIELAERIMGELGLAGDDRKRAISWFNSGKQPDCPFSELAAQCSAAVDPRAEAQLLGAFAAQAEVAREPDKRDQAHAAMRDLTGLLRYRGARLGPDPAPGGAPATPRATASTEAWQFFELAPGSSAEQIRLAYRRFVSRCHPDRLPASATEAEQALAQHRMVEARAAYEELLLLVGDRS